MNLYGIIEKALAREPGFIADNGALKKWVIINKAQNHDAGLLALLLDNKKLKEKFFLTIKNVLIFNQSLFIQFMEQKNYLNDSYTAYKNKVGLTIDGKFLKQRNEVALVWPFKDCVLEGGQSREEDKREEIFFNEILAQDEITQLLEPKVLTNAKRYSAKGEMPLDKFNRNATGLITDNLLIKGNNLLALHSLKEEFAGKIKLIYIDPPYNTEKDSFKYNDRFTHSTWLTFMKNRLEVAKELLRDDGAIFIQVDDKEMAYLKVMCDEIFGRENFRESISIKNGSESGVNAINVMRGEQLFKVKEHLLYYSKVSSLHKFIPAYLKAMSYNNSYRLEILKDNNNFSVKDIYKDTLKKLFKQDSLRKLTPQQKQLFFSEFQQYCLTNNENIYALKLDIQKSGEAFKAFAIKNKTKGFVEEYLTSDGRINLVYQGGMLSALKDRIVKENGENFYGTLISDFWWDIGATPSSEGNVELKAGKKAERLLSRIIEMCSSKHDLVLDYHLGSGSTCAVAHKLQRQYIGIEQLDYHENDSTTRLQNVIGGDSTGISKTVEWQGGGEFVNFELKKYNQNFIDQIVSAKTTISLLTIWNEMKARSFLNYNVDLKKQEAHMDEFKALSLSEQKQHLIALLDKNQLYVNLSSLYDKDFEVSAIDKKITKDFYRIKGK